MINYIIFGFFSVHYEIKEKESILQKQTIPLPARPTDFQLKVCKNLIHMHIVGNKNVSCVLPYLQVKDMLVSQLVYWVGIYLTLYEG